MAEGAILEPPSDEGVEAVAAEQDAPEEVPSVFSVTNHYLVGGVAVTDPAEDGSRVIRLQSASGGAVIEANLSSQLWDFINEKLNTVEIISEDDEVVVDAEVDEDAERP